MRTARRDAGACARSPVVGKRHHHHHRSPQSLALEAGCRVIVKNAVRMWALQPKMRWPFDTIDRLAEFAPLPAAVSVELIDLPSCPAELICAAGISARRAVLYLHGGAFLTCGLNTHRPLVTRLSRAADAEVLNIGYRMLPNYGPSAAVADALDGLRWLVRRGYQDRDIVLAGDSAGGYLALVTTLELLRRGHTPAGVAAISPLTDLNPESKLNQPNSGRCSMFTARAMSVFARHLATQRRSAFNRHIISPVDAKLTDMPPVSIHVSTDELLLSDAELMYQRMNDAGATCDLHLWDGQIHDFPLAADILPEGRRAIRYVGEFIKQVTPASDEDAVARDYARAASL
ncbi:alpha/beta hydrolase [Mycobacterium sp. 141]|uniref:alpha/beta hydrolase n=1 Tax=Mycobacterium sp. 141 TaxID=1120797 RepID=UPI0018C91710|nr:alpha/beta hydrolase fold domain-containing protein [Mycobacterium sp. 141]